MPLPSQSLDLGPIAKAADSVRASLRESRFAERFWSKDPGLWPGGDAKDVAGMLGWIDVVPTMQGRIDEIDGFVTEIREAGFERVVVAGMGGSSLAPYVFSTLFSGGLPVTVLDSTHPGTVLEVERGGDLAKTLFIVASKSGSTAEPSAFDDYFFDHVGRPENFVAITDPGSPFAKTAEKRKFRKIFLKLPDIGGRYSALSYFGLVPAALLGADLRRLLGTAQAAIDANRTDDGDAFALGAAIGTAAKEGRDKLTFLTDPRWSSFGLWLPHPSPRARGSTTRESFPSRASGPGRPTPTATTGSSPFTARAPRPTRRA